MSFLIYWGYKQIDAWLETYWVFVCEIGTKEVICSSEPNIVHLEFRLAFVFSYLRKAIS